MALRLLETNAWILPKMIYGDMLIFATKNTLSFMADV